MKKIRGIIGLVIIALLLFPSVASFLFGRQFETPVYAQRGSKEKEPKRSKERDPRSKISDDLKEKIYQGLGLAVPIVIQTEESPTDALRSNLRAARGRAKQVFRNLNAMSADIPAVALEALAQRSDIKYISLDRPTEATGHLEVTTGADQARNYLYGSLQGNGTPYLGTARTIPGTIQAEDFNDGGQGIAYYDEDTPNNGGYYRDTPVDIQLAGDTGGGYNIGWVRDGEYLKYTVNVSTTDVYDLTVRAASMYNGTAFRVEVDDVDVTGGLTVPNTGSWQVYTNVTKTGINLTAGQHCIKLVSVGGSKNFNWLSLTAASPVKLNAAVLFGMGPAYNNDDPNRRFNKAYDGDVSTFYDYVNANGGFTGIDLGAGNAKRIAQIRYYPRTSFASRMVGGKFQGSNTSSTSGYVTLHTIGSTPPSGQYTTVTITNTTSYRWLRYLSPDGGYCNVAEVEFYTTASASPLPPSLPKLTGTGIGIAILDTGVYSSHHSFLTSSGTGSRVIASVSFTGETPTGDSDGHGTHVASVAAGNNQIANGAYTGIAPEANIISVKVLDSQGRGTTSAVLQGIDWCIANRNTYNIRVMNLSLGTPAVDSYADDPICMAVRRAVNAGIVVCVAAGNLGKDETGRKLYGAIHSPGIEPSAITVGAANTKGTDTRSDDVVATYSSRGPTRGYYVCIYGHKHYDNLIKPDLVAPGNKLIAAQAPQNRLVRENPTLDANVSANSYRKMMRLSGTSAASPVVAGAAALILQKNPNLTPNLVKAILEYTAQPLEGFSNYDQGAGLINVEGAVRLAGFVRQDVHWLWVGDPLLIGATPIQSSTIVGLRINWGGGIIQSWNFITGTALITKYQGIYDQGVLLTDGVLLSGGVLLADGVLLTDGVLLSEGVLLSDGTLLSEGTLLTEGVLLADGTLLIDGTLLSDGVILSDSALVGTAAALSALLVPTTGDLGGEMPVIEDIE